MSSRSHAVFSVHVLVKRAENSTASTLHLVDLAGSEGLRSTSHQGEAKQEGVHINQGLLGIAKVVQALSQGSKVIPYRDSVLSMMLQDSLSARSYLTFLVCISPMQINFSQTLVSLRFAANVKAIKKTPQMNDFIAEHQKKQVNFESKTEPDSEFLKLRIFF